MSRNQILVCDLMYMTEKVSMLPEGFIFLGGESITIGSEQVDCMGTNVSDEASSSKILTKASNDVTLNPLINRKVSSR
jgi:hypothetical protein